MDDDCDDKDDTKRKSRNLSEKKRRDQFNMLINELSSMVSSNIRKMDKSTVLKSTIAFLRNQNEVSARSRVHEIQEDWKPTFLSNEEFTHIVLESVDGFILVFSRSGHILYSSGSVTSLLGHLSSDLMNGPMTMFELVSEDDYPILYDVLAGCDNANSGKDYQLEFSVRVRCGTLDPNAEPVYDLVHFRGYFRGETDSPDGDNTVTSTNVHGSESDSGVSRRMVFVGTGRLMSPHLISEVTFSCESSKNEFTSRHNLDWKFLALDSRATAIIGYVQLEVVGTSGYDYYHVDDLDKIISCHEALMEKGEGTSCYYRFLTKGQQWVWLQTRFYISYHQWNSKPEFVVCTHRVVSYVDVMIQARKKLREADDTQDDLSDTGASTSRRFARSRASAVSRASSCASSKSESASSHHRALLGGPSESTMSESATSERRAQAQIGGPLLTPLLSVDDSRSDKYRSSSIIRHNVSEHSRQTGGSRSYADLGSDSASLSGDSFISKSTNVSMRPVRVRSSSRQHHTSVASTSPAPPMPTYVEPHQHQYVAAIPLQPIIPGYTVSPIPTGEVLRVAGSPVTDHVKRKQQELNQLRQLMCQKEEELQQFVMAQSRYNLVPSLLNVSPYPVPAAMVSSTTQPSQLITLLPPAMSAMSSPREYLPSTSSAESQHSGGGVQHVGEAELLPFQFSQQQAQLLFHSPPPQHPPSQ